VPEKYFREISLNGVDFRKSPCYYSLVSRSYPGVTEMNTETFPFKAIRQFAGATTKIGKFGKSFATPDPSKSDYEVVTYHRTREAAEKTSKSTTHTGYVGILKSGRVEENK
jgi:hypothetical protein